MGTRDDRARAAFGLFHAGDIHLDGTALIEVVALDLLGLGQHGDRVAEFQRRVAGDRIDALYGRGRDLLRL